MIKVKRALISVSDKTGLVEFARGLRRFGVEIISTGGTAKALTKAGIPVIEVSDYTGYPEMLDGRVKTLHPAIHGGLLAARENSRHMAQLADHRIGLIDMVAVNLYPFEKVIQKKQVSLEEAIENIDIGGPAMLRAAAKNYTGVAVVCDTGRYRDIIREMEQNSGILSDTVLVNLALDAFRLTARYDAAIFNFLHTRLKQSEFSSFPRDITLRFSKLQDLRYGENPHQAAAFYQDLDSPGGLGNIKQLHGKELSFNNILDIEAAARTVSDFDRPAAVIIKHNNPTGIAQDATLARAYIKAWTCDKLSAFGGIIGLNRRADRKTAEAIAKSGFMEVVVAPAFDKGAVAVLSRKKNLRLITVDLKAFKQPAFDYKKVRGGMLVQNQDDIQPVPEHWETVTQRKVAASRQETMVFGWKAVKHVRSNAVILVKGQRTVGIGCGQTSRVQSARIAIEKAGKQAKNAVLISDAFLPHPDTVQIAAKAGVKIIVQTGGSIADPQVIKAADRAKLAMVMTGVRHFKH